MACARDGHKQDTLELGSQDAYLLPGNINIKEELQDDKFCIGKPRMIWLCLTDYVPDLVGWIISDYP